MKTLSTRSGDVVFPDAATLRHTLELQGYTVMRHHQGWKELADLQSYADHLIRGVEFRKASRDYGEVHDD